jgi:ribokinase
MVVNAVRIPAPGETILGGTFFMNPGGKGANQAVAAARLGGNVLFLAKTGNDIFGDQARQNFIKEGIDTSLLMRDEGYPSGVALITVDANGENSIVVAPGSNNQLTGKDVEAAAPQIARAGYVLMQLEIPIETVEKAAKIATESHVSVILNPAPAQPLSDSLLKQIAILTPNQTEAELLTGISVTDLPSAEASAKILRNKGIDTVIITLGDQGAYVLTQTESFHVAVQKVKAVDTTAAGDVFNGALVVALSEGNSIRDAVNFACRASAISVTRLGAQASAPYRQELT